MLFLYVSYSFDDVRRTTDQHYLATAYLRASSPPQARRAMGKQRNKDRAYISASEWATEWGGAKDRGQLPFSRLPFHCCALTFTPFGAASHGGAAALRAA